MIRAMIYGVLGLLILVASIAASAFVSFCVTYSILRRARK